MEFTRKLYTQILSFFGIKSDRTKNITYHVIWSFIYKGGSMITMFMMVPLMIQYLDNEKYGIWVTLSSFIVWFSYLDLGLGHGLRNRFAEAKAKGDFHLAKGYVSTAYFAVGVISLLLSCVGVWVSLKIDWTIIFNAPKSLSNQFDILMPIVFGIIGLQLWIKLILSIYIADQRPSIQGKINFISALVSLLTIWLLTYFTEGSLLVFGICFSGIPILIGLGLNILAFKGRYRQYKPAWKCINRIYFKDIVGLGSGFFLIQISTLILYTTDNFIITQYLGPKEVVPYNLAQKYLGISMTILVLILTPYWSGITQAFSNGEYRWIKKSMINLLKLVFACLALIALMVIVSPFIYNLWVGDMVNVSVALTVCMAIYYSFSAIYAPFNYFINGTGKIRLHTYSFTIGAIINIPLSIGLVQFTNLGSKGVIIATILCIMPNLIIFPMQYHKIINRKAIGIWNK